MKEEPLKMMAELSAKTEHLKEMEKRTEGLSDEDVSSLYASLRGVMFTRLDVAIAEALKPHSPENVRGVNIPAVQSAETGKWSYDPQQAYWEVALQLSPGKTGGGQLLSYSLTGEQIEEIFGYGPIAYWLDEMARNLLGPEMAHFGSGEQVPPYHVTLFPAQRWYDLGVLD